ncbi:hypothetical protein GW17_00031393 [Ensete ventricosum]|nr:hypothetical protein GW17_00031393 [Ensete ventricosum]
MRLNRIESFNVFAVRIARRRGWSWLAARGNRLRPRPPTWGRLAMANLPPAGATGCSQRPLARGLPATCKGRPLAGAVGCGQPTGVAASGAPARDYRQRPARKGQPPAASPQEATHGAPARASRQRLVRKRLPTAHPQGAAASRGDDAGRRGGRPLAGWLPAAMRSVAPCAGAAAMAAVQEGEVEG